MFGSWSVDAPLNSPVLSEHPCETYKSHLETGEGVILSDSWLEHCKSTSYPPLNAKYVQNYNDAIKSGSTNVEARGYANHQHSVAQAASV